MIGKTGDSCLVFEINSIRPACPELFEMNRDCLRGSINYGSSGFSNKQSTGRVPLYNLGSEFLALSNSLFSPTLSCVLIVAGLALTGWMQKISL